jgi:D-alanyl-lipoteichoic acid acyltransferase DltB (MBOAT superfamily)
MTFNSLPFLVFFALVFPTYWLLRGAKRKNALLLVASYVFYGWWDPRFLLLIAGTTVIDYYAVREIERARTEGSRRAWMIFSVGVNLAVLGFFKYAGFFVDSANTLLEKFGLGGSHTTLEFLLPVGISFYVFHEISYAVDVYRRQVSAERNLVTYAT